LDKNSNSFTLTFAVIVCVVFAAALASTYNGLKSTIDANAEFDKKKNVLLAMGFAEKGAQMSRKELERIYAERVEGTVLEVKRAEVPVEVKEDGERKTVQVEKVVDLVETDHDVAELVQLRHDENRKPEAERTEYAAIYRGTTDDGSTVWAIPISGYGLWSTLYGFLALEGDLDTVRGITFYKHGETPGLGGEVDNPAWQRSWEGKTILDEKGHVVGVIVKKGVVDPKIAFEKEHMVDGLSGATITSNGVTKFVKHDLETYEPYFAKHRTD
jgi:Na+-transporting NADH:ubiquinone oxidoreductase subunit C